MTGMAAMAVPTHAHQGVALNPDAAGKLSRANATPSSRTAPEITHTNTPAHHGRAIAWLSLALVPEWMAFKTPVIRTRR